MWAGLAGWLAGWLGVAASLKLVRWGWAVAAGQLSPAQALRRSVLGGKVELGGAAGRIAAHEVMDLFDSGFVLFLSSSGRLAFGHYYEGTTTPSSVGFVTKS